MVEVFTSDQEDVIYIFYIGSQNNSGAIHPRSTLPCSRGAKTLQKSQTEHKICCSKTLSVAHLAPRTVHPQNRVRSNGMNA